jgi:hypothetical protein
VINLYIILAGIASILLESSLVTWPWFLLYCFTVLRKQIGDKWLYWLLFLAILVDILAFRTIGITAILMLVLVIIERFLSGNQVSFWFFEPLGVFILLIVWGKVNSQPWWISVVFSLIFGVIGFMVKKKENFVSLR